MGRVHCPATSPYGETQGQPIHIPRGIDSRPLEVDRPKDSTIKSHKDYRDHEAAMLVLESRVSVRDSGLSHPASVGNQKPSWTSTGFRPLINHGTENSKKRMAATYCTVYKTLDVGTLFGKYLLSATYRIPADKLFCLWAIANVRYPHQPSSFGTCSG